MDCTCYVIMHVLGHLVHCRATTWFGGCQVGMGWDAALLRHCCMYVVMVCTEAIREWVLEGRVGVQWMLYMCRHVVLEEVPVSAYV